MTTQLRPSPEAEPLILKTKGQPLSRTTGIAELDIWRRQADDNPWLLTGYRRTLGSYSKCLESLWYAHNDSVNIWTHLVGSLVAFFSLAYALLRVMELQDVPEHRVGWWAPFTLVHPFKSPSQPSVTWRDTAGFVSFFLSAAFCLGCSASFHTFTAHSMAVSHSWNRLDYIGIVVLIVGTIIPCIRYGFFCSTDLQHLYIAAISIAGAATIAVVVAPHTRTPEYRRFRTALFTLLGVSAVIPIGHVVLKYGMQAGSDAVGVNWAALGGILYIIGAFLYAERCPECLWPGVFDYVGASHQLFHVAIVLGATAHYCSIAEAFRFWHGEMGGQCIGPFADR
ncbi:hypothetical protein RQP46_007055 [Phenoliferia psychrophenolica]